MEKILRIDTRKKTYKFENIPNDWLNLGGRGLVSKILLEEVNGSCDPLGSGNKLIISPGLLVGYGFSGCDRLSIGAKSPLTGGIKETNVGGGTGLFVARLGLKALIVEDIPEDDGWSILLINKDGVRFDDAESIIGLGVYESVKRIQIKYGFNIAISIIGPGGEQQLPSAGIVNLNRYGFPSGIVTRGGIGAVMGSKHLKAIVWEGDIGLRLPPTTPKDYSRISKQFTEILEQQNQTNSYQDYGTISKIIFTNDMKTLPVNNFSQGISLQTITDSMENQICIDYLYGNNRGTIPHNCLEGSVIQSYTKYIYNNGIGINLPLKYETIGMLGSNLGITELEYIFRINREVIDLGLDTIEIGAALGVVAEAGLVEFGNPEAMLDLVAEIRKGSMLGQIIGGGAAKTGKEFCVKRVPVVKGQAIPAYDPRIYKITGITFATSPQGTDHMFGVTIWDSDSHLSPKWKTKISYEGQIWKAALDTLGANLFSSQIFFDYLEIFTDLLNVHFDWQEKSDIFQKIGRNTLILEHDFNKSAGFNATDDRLPQWMYTEKVPPSGAVFDVPNEYLDNLFSQ